MAHTTLGTHHGLQTVATVTTRTEARELLDNLPLVCTVARAGAHRGHSPAEMAGFEADFTRTVERLLAKYLAA